MDAFVAVAEFAFASGDPELFAASRERLEAADFTTVLRGYDTRQVDRYVARAMEELEAGPTASDQPDDQRDDQLDLGLEVQEFNVTIRGYDKGAGGGRRAESGGRAGVG